MGEYGRAPDSYKSSFSFSFEKEFSDLFRTKYGFNKYYPINKVYNDFIHDRHHTHMNSTRWSSLHGFALHLQSTCEDGKPNKFGLLWKISNQSRTIRTQTGESAGDVEETIIMLVDLNAIRENERKA